MKTKLLFLFLFAGMVTATAKERTEQSMMQAAQKAIFAKANRSGLRKAAANMPLNVIERNPQLTIIGGEAGFAVIANDDAFEAVQGYSDKPFVAEKAAPGFRWWLDAMNEQLAYNLANGVKSENVRPEKAGLKSSVAELLQTKWGQDAPFNDQTPTYENSKKEEVHYVTGCVATAMAQIMYYHRWPEKGKGSVSYYFTPEGSTASQKLSDNLAKSAYDWDNMLPVYKNHGPWTDAQRKSVSTLMKHCGYSVKMQYTRTGSGAFTHDACDALSSRFYYHPNMHFYRRDYFPNLEWMEKIFEEISAGRPVLYGGASQREGGHEFVLDGYDEEGFVHVNWGWEGSSDGFFNIADLKGYTAQQEMVQVRKNTDDVQYASSWGLYDGLVISNRAGNITSRMHAMNFDVNSFSGLLCLVAEDLSTGKITVLGSEQVSNIEYLNEDANGNNYFYELSFNANLNKLPDGNYRIYAASYNETKDQDYQPMRCNEKYSNSYLLTILNGKIALKDEKNANWTATTGISNVLVNERKASESDGMVRVYDAQGRKLYESSARSFNLDQVPFKGLLIVNDGKRVRKIQR